MDILRKTVIALACVAMGGCAALIQPYPEEVYRWYQTRDPLPYTEHLVPQDAVQAYCAYEYPQGDSSGDGGEAATAKSTHGRVGLVAACSYWDTEHCWIFASTPRLMDLMREHEVNHCLGRDHQVI